MRKAPKKDANQSLIVTALRKAGVKVRILDERDVPDLLCSYQGKISLLEVKDGRRKPSERRLRPGQQAFFDEWSDSPVFKVETLADAFRALEIPISASERAEWLILDSF